MWGMWRHVCIVILVCCLNVLCLLPLVAVAGPADQPLLPHAHPQHPIKQQADPNLDPYANAMAMRWRVYSNQERGVSFRYPYYFITPDQYKPQIVRGQRWFIRDGQVLADIELKSAQVMAGQSLRQMAVALMSQFGHHDMRWSDYDYYQSPEDRPFASTSWAPEGVEALLGQSASHVVLILRYEDRLNALVISGDLSNADSRKILDHFEVMSREPHKRSSKRGLLMTYRESVCSNKRVFDNQDNPVRLTQGEPVPWAQAYEMETAHYHLTAQINPEQLYYYGALCETVYQEFYRLYQPDTLIPYKMEIQIFNSYKEFAAAAESVGSPVHFGMGGFFHPGLLCIFAYAQTTEIAADFTLAKVLVHEMSHQFLHVTCNGSTNVPTWLNEGLAVYFETFEMRRGRYVNRPPTTRISQLAAAYRQRNSTLMPMSQYIQHYGQLPGLSYAEVYAMTHFWIFGTGSQGRSRFVRYWKALKEGEDGTDSFERIFLQDMIKAKGSRVAALQAWETELKRYVQQTLVNLK